MTDPTLTVVTGASPYIKDGDNNIITLKGLQIDYNQRHKTYGGSTSASSPTTSWFTEADVQRLKLNGLNYFEIVTIPISSVMPTSGTLDTSYCSTWLDEYATWAEDNGVYVSLDLATPYGSTSSLWQIPSWFWTLSGYSQPTTDTQMDDMLIDYFDTDVAAMDPTRAAVADLWAQLANRYQDNDRVLFSLMNEPLNGVDVGDAATAKHLGETYVVYIEDIVDAIQATGASNVIIVNTPYVASYADYFDNVDDINKTQVVWEDHGYMTSTRNYASWQSYVDTAFTRLVGTFNKPVIYGEYGFDPPEHGKDTYPSTWLTHLQNMTAYLKAKTGCCGVQFHQWGLLDGEYYDYVSDFYTATESQTILTAVASRPENMYYIYVYDRETEQALGGVEVTINLTEVQHTTSGGLLAYETSVGTIMTFDFLKEGYEWKRVGVQWGYPINTSVVRFEGSTYYVPMDRTGPIDPPPPTYYTVVCSAESHGQVDPAGSTQVLVGQAFNAVAIPAKDYKFDHWTLDGTTQTSGANFGPFTGEADTTYTLVAYFVDDSPTTPDDPSVPDSGYFTVNVQATTGGSVDPEGESTALAGETITATQVPDEGYRFVYWLYNGTTQVYSPSGYSISGAADTKYTLLAVFQKYWLNNPNEPLVPATTSRGLMTRNRIFGKAIKTAKKQKRIDIQQIFDLAKRKKF